MLRIRFKKLGIRGVRNALLIILYLYPLVVRRQWKIISGVSINSISVTNEVYVYPLIFAMLAVLSTTRTKRRELPQSSLTESYLCFILYAVAIMVVGMLMNIDSSIEQSLYASWVILLNIFALSAFYTADLRFLIKFNRIIIITTIIYALLQIYTSFNMRSIASILGNTIQSKNYINENQFRGKLPLGFPTTVVFYFALSIPFIYLEYSRAIKKTTKMFCIGSSFIVLFAALMTGSRGGAALTGFMIIWSVYKLRERGKGARAIAIFLAIVAGLVFVSSYVDLSRIFTRFNDSSTSARIEALKTSLDVVLEKPVFGTGVGKYYHRIYENRIISIFGQSTVIDPHNAYTLLLSEIGFIGFILFSFLFYINTRKIIHIREHKWRLAAEQSIFVFLAYSAIGSQVINEISISIISWLYLGFFIRFADLERLQG